MSASVFGKNVLVKLNLYDLAGGTSEPYLNSLHRVERLGEIISSSRPGCAFS